LSNILKFIDDETEWILKDEMAKKFQIFDDIHDLFEICS